MENRKYTPPPWNVRVFNDGLGKYPDGSYRHRTVFRIGVPQPEFNWTKELAPTATLIAMVVEIENEANAKLIAAAPELLEALKLILNDNRLMNAMNHEQARAIMDSVFKAEGP